MDNYRLSTEDWQAIEMIAEHYGYARNSQAYAYLAGFSRSVLWAELDKITRP